MTLFIALNCNCKHNSYSGTRVDMHFMQPIWAPLEGAPKQNDGIIVSSQHFLYITFAVYNLSAYTCESTTLHQHCYIMKIFFNVLKIMGHSNSLDIFFKI